MPIPDETPSRLYKYFPPRDYVEQVIRGEGIKFTCPLEFNDPFECRYRITYDGTPKKIEGHFRRVARVTNPSASWADRKQFARTVAARFLQGPIFAHELPQYEQLMRKWGVLSLSERFDSILMWSHYAADHRGICIGFDADKDFYRLAAQVSYEEEMPICDFLKREQEGGAESVLKSALLTKSKDWSYEKEWRVLKNERPPEEIGAIVAEAIENGYDGVTRRSLADQYGPGLYPFDPSVVVEIILGLRIEPDYEQKVRDWAQSADCLAAFYRTKYVRGEYRLEREPA